MAGTIHTLPVLHHGVRCLMYRIFRPGCLESPPPLLFPIQQPPRLVTSIQNQNRLSELPEHDVSSKHKSKNNLHCFLIKAAPSCNTEDKPGVQSAVAGPSARGSHLQASKPRQRSGASRRLHNKRFTALPSKTFVLASLSGSYQPFTPCAPARHVPHRHLGASRPNDGSRMLIGAGRAYTNLGAETHGWEDGIARIRFGTWAGS